MHHSPLVLTTALLLSFLVARPACANTEKAIFVAPRAVPVPTEHPNLDDLALERLSPARSVLSTHLAAAFPSGDDHHRRGNESWYLLEGLSEGQRYEVRVCWVATQPTAFQISPYPIQTVFQDPSLITSLASFSEARRKELREAAGDDTASGGSSQSPELGRNKAPVVSVLFLRISAAADYFTADEGLMLNVPPVAVDIILDPYILNILPRSLVPTAAYILLVAVVAVYLSGFIWRWLQGLGGHEEARLKPSEPQPGSDIKKVY